MEEFDDAIDQDLPALLSWEDSPVIRMAVARAWMQLARLHPTNPNIPGETDEANP